MKKIYLMLSLGIIGLSSIFETKGQTTLDAEFRPRTEFREGLRKPLADTLNPAFITLQRTRFNADYKGKILNARISLQDARIWGNSDNKTNTSKVEIYEAWFEYLITSGLSVEAGRQPLKYDDQRIFATSNWSNTGITHDALLLKYNSRIIQAHAGFAYNNTKDTFMNVAYKYTPKQNYKTMGYAWLSKDIHKSLSVSLIGICDGFESKSNFERVYPRITYGGNIVFANDSTAWGGVLTAYMQSGKDPNKIYGKGYAELNSYFLAIKGTYKIAEKAAVKARIDTHPQQWA